MPGRRVLITGVANRWGVALARRRAGRGDVDRVLGIDTRPLPPDVAPEVERVELDLRSPDVAAAVRATGADVVVHNDVLRSPNRAGPAARCTT
jgi:nucleoside-diphosphate-sugar epimerase